MRQLYRLRVGALYLGFGILVALGIILAIFGLVWFIISLYSWFGWWGVGVFCFIGIAYAIGLLLDNDWGV